jgi:hypothetical protein
VDVLTIGRPAACASINESGMLSMSGLFRSMSASFSRCPIFCRSHSAGEPDVPDSEGPDKFLKLVALAAVPGHDERGIRNALAAHARESADGARDVVVSLVVPVAEENRAHRSSLAERDGVRVHEVVDRFGTQTEPSEHFAQVARGYDDSMRRVA